MFLTLFDIDGTLIRSGGAGKKAMESALKRAFGVEPNTDGIPFSGRTDLAITRDLFERHGADFHAANRALFYEHYFKELPHALSGQTGLLLPGASELLRRCAERTDIGMGLLTGNTRRGAYLKLAHYGVDHFFAYGGFGDDHECRDDVARAALSAAQLFHGSLIKEVWVIGDTPLDIRCARAIGAKAAAVATGEFSRDRLAACEPDALWESLEECLARAPF